MNKLITALLFSAKYQRPRLHAAFILYFLILVLGSVPHARAEIANVAPGLILHSVAYSVITFLLFTGSTGDRLGKSIRAVLIVVIMGAFDEYVQSFFPYRNAAVSDLLVDSGASLVTAVLLLKLGTGQHARDSAPG